MLAGILVQLAPEKPLLEEEGPGPSWRSILIGIGECAEGRTAGMSQKLLEWKAIVKVTKRVRVVELND
jgi:hypothetical protein